MAAAATPIALAELAERLGCELLGDGAFSVAGVAALADARDDELSFVRSHRYLDAMRASRAGALIVPPGIDPGARPAIRSADPSLHFARAVEMLVVPPRPGPGIDARASVAPDASIDESAAIGPGVSVGAGAQIGADCVLHANVSIYAGVSIGTGCELHAGVVVREGSVLGDRVRLQPGVLIGGDGFGFLPSDSGGAQRVPQVGRVVIEDDVEIGAGSTVDRATLGETRIRRGAKIDNLVMIAHNCDIGEDAIIVAQSGLGGGTRVGRRAILMARVGAAGQLEVGEAAFVGARAGLHGDVPAGTRVWGSPAVAERRWHRENAALRHLPGALRRLRAVERKLGLRPAREGPAANDGPREGDPRGGDEV